MTSCQQCQTLLTLIRQSCDSGAHLQKACARIGLDARTVQRWKHPGNQQGDLRVSNKRRITVPPNKLSEAERQSLRQRCGWQKDVIALANKNARILWAVMTREKRYDAHHVSVNASAVMPSAA